MVKITNGINVFEVTRGAFNGVYSHQGYRLCDETVAQEPREVDDKVDENQHEEDKADSFCSELLEKPISQWSKDEVKKFAEIKGIDLSGTKNANEAKDRIKEFLD